MASHFTRLESSATQLWEPQICYSWVFLWSVATLLESFSFPYRCYWSKIA
jgi:hypothetical protein